MLFLGNDWAEAHHDIELVDESGRRLARRRLPEGVDGLAGLHSLIADHLDEDDEADQVIVGIETDRGPWVQALIAAGYTVYAINPRQVARYRERHGTAGAKSDPGDAHVLAELVRLDRAHHRPVAGDSALAEHIKVLTRTHQSLIWSRQRQTNALRSMLREFYPAALAAFGEDLASREALAILAIAPAPEAGRRLSQSKIAAALRRAGRQRSIDASAERIQTALRTPQLEAHPGVVSAYAAAVRSLIAVIDALVTQVEALRGEVEAGFGRHPDAEIYLSQPGLGPILGARVLAEFGDDPHRYADAKGRKNYSGMAPITRASGLKPDKERTASYTKASAKQAKEQTRLMREQAALARAAAPRAATAHVAPSPAPAPQLPPAGWYADKQDPSIERWFDGTQWTEFTQPRRV
ncbi:IS110 family transposase [Blastococcus goldschmidtiae]|uniref:Transposase n=1 Tax=Blastococcus goldschmidtiae TaxID=3075546 RepID=A0ABU2KBM4_9ACTN|nr:transposase [Blastococcus sp. DSM 46792]MDT0277588.1 transposase [Blastococcus sp. DSM 46792]